MRDKSKPVPVKPDAVRVWRGFKLATLDTTTYYQKLGEILIPATIQIQAALGLTAYLPTILPGDIPYSIPDEIALVFYESQEVYEDTFKTTGGRGYGLMHSAIFDFTDRVSETGFPQLAGDDILFDQPYYLFEGETDWMLGVCNVLVGGRPDTQTKEEFLSTLSGLLKNLQAQRPEGMDNAYFVITSDYLVYWELWTNKETAAGSKISQFAEAVSPILMKEAANVFVPPGLDRDYEGLEITGGDCLNIQFHRRGPW